MVRGHNFFFAQNEQYRRGKDYLIKHMPEAR